MAFISLKIVIYGQLTYYKKIAIIKNSLVLHNQTLRKMKFVMSFLLVFLIASVAIGQGYTSTTAYSVGSGLSIGAVIAIVASWSRNKSILWAIIHAFLGWIYVIYYVITR